MESDFYKTTNHESDVRVSLPAVYLIFPEKPILPFDISSSKK
jgi:hypothetical protein